MESATIREVQHNLAAYLRKVEHGVSHASTATSPVEAQNR